MGEVFAAENIRTGRPVAVKLLRADSKSKSSAVTRFRREARAAGSINSDHVTQVLDVEDDPEHGIVLVFELLTGESLIDRLRRTGPIPFDELHPIVEQVWLGLADAHRAGIIHRDLKPSNVFLEQRPDGLIRVKILDFGISKLPKDMGGDTLTEMGQSLGTFSFMPPEQINKAKIVDHRADIYACATLIYQALTGQLPYNARNVLTMVEMKTKTEPRKLSEVVGWAVDPHLEAFLTTGLARDPAQRFQTAVEGLAAWRELRPVGPSNQSSAQPGVAAVPSSGALNMPSAPHRLIQNPTTPGGPLSPPAPSHGMPNVGALPSPASAISLPGAVLMPPPNAALMSSPNAAPMAAHARSSAQAPQSGAPIPLVPPHALLPPQGGSPRISPPPTAGGDQGQAPQAGQGILSSTGSDMMVTLAHQASIDRASVPQIVHAPQASPVDAPRGPSESSHQLPRIYDESSEGPPSQVSTQVYRPKQSGAPTAAPERNSALPTSLDPARPRSSVLLYVLAIVAFALVGFAVVALLLR